MNKWFIAMAAVLVACFGTDFASAQGGGTDPGGGGNNGGNNNAAFGGIDIDAEGVLRTRMLRDTDGRVDRERIKAAKSSLNTDLQRSSNLRKVSLKRYEAAVREAKASGQPMSEDMLHVAGLTRITHVFFFPDCDEIVIAGPAEGFYTNYENRTVGIESGSAILNLEDLVVALRAFAPGEKPTGVISVSIDPTPEGSARVAETFQQLTANPNNIRGNEQFIAESVRRAMGLQLITIQGVSPKTRFAQILAEADYRMKMIGMGLEVPPVKITNYVDHMPMVSNNALNRWYFQPQYESVIVNDDETSMELEGHGVELVAEQDRLQNGERVEEGQRANKAARNFAASFTKNYDKLAEKMPLYGELRNLIDLSVAAAFIRKADLYEKADWSMSFFGDEAQFACEKYIAPTHVEPVVNAVWKDGAFSTPVGGGITIVPYTALKNENQDEASIEKVNATRKEIKLDQLTDGQWWWD